MRGALPSLRLLKRHASLSALAIVLIATPATAQLYSSAFVPADHWSIDAVRRLAGIGLTPAGHDLARRAPTQREVGAILEAAAAADSAGRSPADAWLARYRAEFGIRPQPTPLQRLAGSALEAGGLHHEGRLGTGWGYGFYYPGVDWRQPEPRADRTEAALAGALQATLGPVAARVSVVQPVEGEALREAYVAGTAGAVTGWIGRRELSWGPGPGAGLVMNRGRYDSFGILTTPFHLPWLLRHVGPVSIEMALGMDDFERTFEDVGVLATRGSVTPHERLQLGVTRAAFFGGDGNASIDLFGIFSLLIGKHAGDISELDNQIVAVDASYRPPTERWLPMRGYVEWGFEDSAGAFRDVPGIIAGIEVPAMPGVPGLAVGVERASFARSCCGNPIWYRHSTFRDGWTQDDRPLGHPLGGHGYEWTARASLHVLDARLRLDGAGFVRRRGDENLYADVRTGRSTGAELGVEADLTDGLRLRADAGLEDGAGWREVRIGVALRAIL
jgi:hypothetical protein